MNILIVTRSFDQRLGGMESHTRSLAEHFLANKWQVTVATPDVPPSGAVFEATGLNFIRLGKTPNDLIKYSPAFWLRVRRILVTSPNHYDVAINIGMAIGGSFFLPKSIRAKIITIAHGTYARDRRTFFSDLRKGNRSLKVILGIPYTYMFDAVQKLVNSRSAYVICVSEGVYASLRKDYRQKPNKLTTIRNFVDAERFKGLAHKGNGQQYIMLYLARLHAPKGVLFLLESFNEMREKYPRAFNKIQCYIAGDGPDSDKARALAEHLNLKAKATFLGRVDRDAVPAVMARADFYVLPTLVREGLPTSLIEALLAELPSIASDIEGPNEIIENGKSGILFKLGDKDAFQRAIVQLLSDRTEMDRLGKNGRARALSDFNASKQLAKIDALLSAVAEPAKKDAPPS